MAVLHYISEVHKMGHTRRVITPQVSISEQGDVEESPQQGRRSSFGHHNDPRDGGDDTQEKSKRSFSDPGVPVFRAKRWEGTLDTIPGDVVGSATRHSDRSVSSVFDETQSGEGVSATGEVMPRLYTLLLRGF